MSTSQTRSNEALQRPKRLLIRLSSLGDVILATSSLEVYRARGERVDWVISKEYFELLEGHPAIGKLWIFDRKEGLAGWLSLGQKLWQEKYEEVYDLHSTLRSGLLRLLFFVWGLSGNKTAWKKISKQRLRLYGLFLFKGLWPKSLYPTSLVSRSAKLCGGSGEEKPNLSHLIEPRPNSRANAGLTQILEMKRPYYCVMPSAKWEGKKWPTRYFADFMKDFDLSAVVMGTMTDRESLALVESLKDNTKVHSAVGFYKFAEVAAVLSRAKFFFGNDTGLGHLAEAVGVPALTVMGPTVPGMGFGPWRKQSHVFESKLWCQPCGKDGRFCYRLNDRYSCLRQLGPDLVRPELDRHIKAAGISLT